MTNFDKIKAMTPIEFEDWLDEIVFYCKRCLSMGSMEKLIDEIHGIHYDCPLPVCPFDNDDYKFAKWLESELDANE